MGKRKVPRRPPAGAPELPPGDTPKGRGWLNFRMLEVFVAVIQEKGMTPAARRLGMTQSAVSQAITAIEAGLGTQLIDRSVRPAHLTLFGAGFYDRAVEMLHRARELEHLVDMQQHARLTQVRIGMVDSVASTAGPTLLREMASLAARWSVVSGVQQTSIRSVIEQRVDMVLTNDDPASDPGLLALTVLREPFVMVAPKSADVGKGAVAEMARALPLVRYGSGGFLSQQVASYLGQNDLAPPPAYELDTSDAVLAMVRAGLGWTITTPLCVLKASGSLDELRVLQLERAPVRTVRVVAYKDGDAGRWERMAHATRAILKRDWVPAMKRIAPWAAVRVE